MLNYFSLKLHNSDVIGLLIRPFSLSKSMVSAEKFQLFGGDVDHGRFV